MKKRKKTDLEIRRSKLGKVYFTEDTENAIVLYNNESDDLEREILFREKIHPALDKLVENVINRFKFPYVDGTFDDVKNQVVSFLTLNLGKYEKANGKAFSYFSVVAKNYLILLNNNAYKDEIRTISMTDVDGDKSFQLEEILSTSSDGESNRSDAEQLLSLLVQYWDFNLNRIFKKQRDRDIANAVVELMRRSNSIENFNKKSLYVLIREMTDNKTVHITKVINKMKIHVLQQIQEYRSTGHLSDVSMFFVSKSGE